MNPPCIDKDINERLASPSNLQKDSLSSILRLPPETLADIFICGARDYYYGIQDDTLCVPQWVNVSYVCRLWRDVALDCPTLWSYHFTVSLRWTDELLTRSKQASLKIRIVFDFQGDDPWWVELIEKSLAHAERIQELCLLVPNESFLPSKFSLCAPRLQLLDIVAWENPHERNPTITDVDVPSLRVLKLTYYTLPWHSLNLSRLTTFSLCDVPHLSRQNVTELLAALRCMQALAILHLEHALPSARGFLSSTLFDVSSKIELPCLARLLVVAPHSAVIAFLSCVNIPLKTQLRLGFEEDNGSSVNDYAQIPLFLAQRFNQSKDPTIRSFVICFPPGWTFTLCASESHACNPHVSIANPQWHSNTLLVVSVQIGRPLPINDWIVSDICCSIPLADVQTLHVLYPPTLPDFWAKILGRLHGLRHITLRDISLHHLAPLLALIADEENPRMPSDSDPTPGHKYVPLLEELTFRGVIFALEDDLSRSALTRTALLCKLSSRKALHLHFVECGVGGSDSGMVDGDASDSSDE